MGTFGTIWDAFWWLWTLFNSFGHFLEAFGGFWTLLEAFGGFLRLFRGFWMLLEAFGPYCTISEHFGPFWNIFWSKKIKNGSKTRKYFLMKKDPIWTLWTLAVKCQALIDVRRLGLVRLCMNPNMNIMNLFWINMDLKRTCGPCIDIEVPIVPIGPFDPFSTA